jgi:YVTN family beta-propeller protein
MSRLGKYLLRTSERTFQSALLAIVLCAMPALAAPFAYVVNTNQAVVGGPGSVSVIDSASNTVTATITVPSQPTGIALTPDGVFAYVTNASSNVVSVIGTATNTVVASVPVSTATESFSVAITPNGAYAYVVVNQAVAVIATATHTVVANIPIPNEGIGQSSPIYVAITPNGAFAYVGDHSLGVVWVIATATNKIVTAVKVGGQVQTLAITPDGNFVYEANSGNLDVSVIQTATNTVVANYRNASQLDTYGVALNPNGAWAYVSGYNPGSVEVISTASATGVTNIPLANPGAQGLAVSPNGAFVYVANSLLNSVSVISTATNSVVTSVPVGPFPVAVAFAPSPAPVSVTPNPASGLTVTFALTYTDLYGASDLGLVGVVFNSQVALANSCTVFYAPSTNLIYLYNDAGTGWSSVAPGAGTLTNSQCTITRIGTSVATSGNNLTLNLSVTVSPTYTGKHGVFMRAQDNRDSKSGWVNKGTWSPTTNQPPAVVSVTPNPASGRTNTFALTYSDSNGASDLYLVEALFSSVVSALNSCEVFYVPATNLLYLVNDAGSGTSSIFPGSGTLSNSQCTITGSGTSVATSGDTLTLNVEITASPTFTGTKNIYMFAEDNSFANTGAVNKGTWTP